jgi:lipoprotein-releasing system permease protein
MGAIVGILLGLLLCWLQQTFGLIALGSSAGSFIVDAYPVSVHASDVIIVFVTVIIVGFLSVWYPVRYFSKRLLSK